MTGVKIRDIAISGHGRRTFWSKLACGEGDECWPWQGRRDRDGYGVYGRTGFRAHRVAWFLANGAQPNGFICHRCDNPSCCNPAHLWLGSHTDNMRDQRRKGRNKNASKSHCAQGHPFDEANTYVHPRTGRRACRQCNILKLRDLRARRRAMPRKSDAPNPSPDNPIPEGRVK